MSWLGIVWLVLIVVWVVSVFCYVVSKPDNVDKAYPTNKSRFAPGMRQ